MPWEYFQDQIMEENSRINSEMQLKSAIETALIENDRIVAERFKLMMQIEAQLDINSKLFEELKIARISKTPLRFYVGNLTPEINDMELEKYFSKFGEIVDIFMSKRGMFAFVSILNMIDEKSFIKMSHQIKSRLIKVDPERIPLNKLKTKFVIASGSLKSAEIGTFFTTLGFNVVNVSAGRRATLIEFDSFETVEKVLRKLNLILSKFS